MTGRHHLATIDHDPGAEVIAAIGTRDFDLDDTGRHRDPIGLIEGLALRRRAAKAASNDDSEQLQHAAAFQRIDSPFSSTIGMLYCRRIWPMSSRLWSSACWMSERHAFSPWRTPIDTAKSTRTPGSDFSGSTTSSGDAMR